MIVTYVVCYFSAVICIFKIGPHRPHRLSLQGVTCDRGPQGREGMACNSTLGVRQHAGRGPQGRDNKVKVKPTWRESAARKHRLRSSSSSALLVPVMRRTTNGDRVFVVTGSCAWNTLPDFITDCLSSRSFKQYLKTYLFSLSFLST